jgi:hypothetical protein
MNKKESFGKAKSKNQVKILLFLNISPIYSEIIKIISLPLIIQRSLVLYLKIVKMNFLEVVRQLNGSKVAYFEKELDKD